jgi:putative ABC transport system permease protein
MRYALLVLWYDRRRFIAAILAVAVSTTLIAMMVGIMLGLVSLVSIPVDQSQADLWITSVNSPSCDLGLPISRQWENHLLMQPEIQGTDEVIQAYGIWKNPTLGSILVVVVGVNVGESSLGPVTHLTPQHKVLLTEVGSVVVDINDRRQLGISEVGQIGEIYGRKVRVVGFTNAVASVTGPYIFCSLQTAREFLGMREDETVFLLARCHHPRQRAQVRERLRSLSEVTIYDTERFSWKSQVYWLSTTKAGLGVGFVAFLSLLIGAIVTSQTLYAATITSIKELALLRALGAPRWRMRLFVVQQSFLVGIFGIALALPVTFALARLARAVGAYTVLPGWLLSVTIALTLSMALVSGLFALRSLRHSEPGQLLR